MIPVIIGISGGLLTIALFTMLKQFDKKLVYGLILCAIGFIYVGFAWSDLDDLMVNCIQAILFLFLAYFGVKKSMYLLASGFFLHGIWDLFYHMFQDPNLIPPHYDLFCLSIDFTMGFYLLWINYKTVNSPGMLRPAAQA